jgi:hypothetical protein
MKLKKLTKYLGLAPIGAAFLMSSSAFADGVDLANDLVGYWDFNELPGSNAAPNQATGTAGTASDAVFEDTVNTPEWMVGPLCGNVRLNGAASQFFV